MICTVFKEGDIPPRKPVGRFKFENGVVVEADGDLKAIKGWNRESVREWCKNAGWVIEKGVKAW